LHKEGAELRLCPLNFRYRLFRMVRPDLGIRSFAERAEKKPVLHASVELTGYRPGLSPKSI
jgi:hypothetical protein